jgi:hypothetical protein
LSSWVEAGFGARILAQLRSMQPSQASAANDFSPQTGSVIAPATGSVAPPVEIGGPQGPEPTRYGDWEKKGRCIDF